MEDKTLRAILQRIIIEPDEDHHRLVFADRLDDLDHHDWAECIRVEVALWNHPQFGIVEQHEAVGELKELFASYHRLTDSLPEWHALLHNWDTPIASHWERGFAKHLTCTADAFLQHADTLIWHPASTKKCDETYCADHRVWTSKPRKDCQKCGGAGLLIRPCPLTAQPIRKVVLTTYPETHSTRNQHGITYQFDGREKSRLTRQQDEDAHRDGWSPLREMLKQEWPGIQFELPT